MSELQDQNNLTLFVNDQSLSFNKSSNSSITVQYNSLSAPNFTWFDNRNQIIAFNSDVKKNGFRVEINSSHITLKIENVRYNHFGNFCLNAKSEKDQKNISVNVIVKGEKSKG